MVKRQVFLPTSWNSVYIVVSKLFLRRYDINFEKDLISGDIVSHLIKKNS
jgi:hypothetical protein